MWYRVADTLRTDFESSQQTAQKAASELTETKKRLREQRRATDRAENDGQSFKEALDAIKTHLVVALDTARDVRPDDPPIVPVACAPVVVAATTPVKADKVEDSNVKKEETVPDAGGDVKKEETVKMEVNGQ